MSKAQSSVQNFIITVSVIIMYLHLTFLIKQQNENMLCNSFCYKERAKLKSEKHFLRRN